MQLTSVAPIPVYDRVATQRQLNDLAIDLSRSDAELTDAVNRGNRVGSGWDTWFRNKANALLDARDAYVQLRPADADIIARLRASAVDMAESAGQLGSAYRSNQTFGGGWETTLDRKIALVREAADRLYGEGGQPPVTPPVPGSGSDAHADASRAVELIRQSIAKIQTVPASDKGDASTKDARIAAFNLNMQAQQVLEQHFDGSDANITSQLRRADAHLEDANWQLAKKPSPDGRFNGVDIPGALRDSQAAVGILLQLGD